MAHHQHWCEVRLEPSGNIGTAAIDWGKSLCEYEQEDAINFMVPTEKCEDSQPASLRALLQARI